MATIDYDVLYAISFRDRTEFDAAIALFASNELYGVPPAQGLPLFGVAYPPPTVWTDNKIAWNLQYNLSPPESEIFFPASSGVTMDTTVPTTIVPAQYGGSDGAFTWVLLLLFSGGANGPAPTVPIPPRRWIYGAELPQNGEGASTVSGDLSLRVSRDASRTPEGFGVAWRNLSAGNGSLTFSVQGLGQPASPNSWERIYLRSRVRPTIATEFWRCFGSVSPLSGMRLDESPAGGLIVSRVNSGGTATTIGTVGTIPAYPDWGRYDLLINFRDGANQGRFRLYQNGTLILDELIPSDGQGLGQDQDHSSSRIGNPDVGTGNDLELDLDDWHNAEIPSSAGTENLTSRDWNNGSHIVRSGPNAFNVSSSANWTGDWRVLQQNFLQLTQTAFLQALTSSTALAPLVINTETPPVWLQQLGGAAMVTGLFSSRGSVDGRLGYSVPAVGAALTTIAQNTLAIWNAVLLNLPAATLEPADFSTGRSLEYEKGNSGTSASAYSLQCAVEYIGAFGSEDNADGSLPAPLFITPGVHNAPYPGSRWTQGLRPPDNPFIVAGGIYIGNNLGQDVLQVLLPHFWWVRPLSGVSGGTRWWSSMMGAHVGSQTSPTPANMVQAAENPSAGTNAGVNRIAGANAQGNVNPVAYQWIAIMDPGMRHLINGAFMRNSNVASSVTALPDPNFLPDLVMLDVETPGSTVTNRFYYRGPGFASADASQLDGSLQTNALTFTTGAFTTQTVVHNAAASQVAYAAVRAVDPDSCVSEIALVIGTYVGTGVNPRTLTLDLGGRFPLWVLVTPITAVVGYIRDPSHTGSDSSRSDGTGAVVTTAITAGAVDAITVNTLLNQVGVTYSYFIIPGDPTGWNNGVFVLETACIAGCPPYCCDCIDPTPPPLPPEDCVDDWGDARPDGLPYVPLMPPE